MYTFLPDNELDQLYIIEMNLLVSQEIQVGKRGGILFQKGTYVYVGSGRKHIRSRVNRHLRSKKKEIVAS